MVRRIILVLLLVVVGVGVWIFFRVSAIDQAEGEVSSQFHAVLLFYTNIRPQYIEPLLNLPDADASVHADLQNLATHLKELEGTTGTGEQHDHLVSVQREMNTFFKNPALSESVTADAHFIEWNTEASSRGAASALLYRYNTALAAYNAARKTSIGRLMDYWPHWSRSDYLSTDGTTQQETKILF